MVGVDIEIRPENRRAIETHELASYITLVEGDSAAPDVVNRARGFLRPGDKVLVILNSNHTKAHVAKELEAYAPLVTLGSYIVATDGIMGLGARYAARQAGMGLRQPNAGRKRVCGSAFRLRSRGTKMAVQ